MHTQIDCPRCQHRFVADIHQIVDAGQNPDLKRLLLNGYLNVVQCPSCGAVTNVTTPLLYHDPEHELFMVHVPMELSLPQAEQEKLIGQLVSRAMDSLPPEKRRGYMFQPQTVLSLQSFMEKVLETEGITPEMIARQREQAGLLQELIVAGKEEAGRLVKDNAEYFDETFFAMLRAAMEAAEQASDEAQSLKLVNLQARLYRDTEFGRRLESQQKAVHSLSRDAQKEGGLTPALLLTHVIANRNDDTVVNALVTAGQAAFNYEFFLQLSNKIEKRQKAGVSSDGLESLRARLLQVQREMEQRSREIIEGAQRTLNEILNAEDKSEAIRNNVTRLDDAFLYVLASGIAESERQGHRERAAELKEIQGLIAAEIDSRTPPAFRLINQLLQAESEEDQRQLLADNAEMVKPDLLEVVQALGAETEGADNGELSDRLRTIEAMIAARL